MKDGIAIGKADLRMSIEGRLKCHAPKQKIYARVFRDAAVQDDPVTPVVARLAHKPTTLLRRQMVDDDTWYNSGAYKRWREPMGIDDIVHSHDPLPQFGVMSVMGFARAFDEKPFTARERKIVDFVREELRHRWITMKAAIEEQKPLTSRQQQLLTHLRGRMSEKQIAKYMGLSPHTTHNYIKHLYRRLNVSSRPELLQLSLKENSTKMVLPRIGYGDA
jgi:DNA-binding CsgD family transcriptional regulator